MGKSVYFLVLLLCFSVLLVPINSEIGVCDAASEDGFDDDVMRFGVNYFSTHNHYEPYYLQDEELDRDFSLFREQGLKYVTLAIIWAYHEPQEGVYNEAALDDVIRVCNFASKYDLKIIINFYTMMSNNSWTMPTWLENRKFETIFLEEAARTSWLNFLDHCASRLNSTENIWSWHMMNEPARREWACNVSIEAYLELWTQMKAIFNSYSERPVSVRFAAQVFDSPLHFNCDPRICELLDYLALNWYEVYCPRETLTHTVTEVQDQTHIFISEFGNNGTDTEQANNYTSYIDFFENLHISDCVAWMWRADYNLGNPDLPGVNYNLAKDVDGTPRPAFYLLKPQADVSVSTDRARYTKWSYVRVAVTVTDKLNGTLLQNASVDLTVYDTHKRAVWTATATTGLDGTARFTYKLVFNAQMGTYTVNATVSLTGYSTATGQTTFYSLG